MASQQPFVPPVRSGISNNITNGGGGGGSSGGSIATIGSPFPGGGGGGVTGIRGVNDEDEKGQRDDLRYEHNLSTLTLTLTLT